MKHLQVREGNTGILYLTSSEGKEERYIPNYDLDAAGALLAEFEALRDRSGASIKDRYWKEQINWFPTAVNYLFGRVFTSFVRYQPLIAEVLRGALAPVHVSRGDFWRITTLLTRVERGSVLKGAAFNRLVAFNNRRVMTRRPVDVLFFRFRPDDFRTSKAKDAFDELNVSYLEALVGTRALVAASLRGRTPYYLCGYACRSNDFRYEYVVNDLDPTTRALFRAAISKTEEIISGFIREFRGHCRALEGARLRSLYAIDDTQVIYPLLYACQRHGIRTVAHQHGAAYNKRHASYVMAGIEPSEYRWFDTLITWGEFWRDRLQATTRCRPPHVVVGSDLFDFRFAPAQSNSRAARNILVPYEFVTNTHQVGRFVTRLIDLGFNVHMKVRSDENVADQIDAYCLPSRTREKLTIVSALTPELLQQIDIVAGTASTLIYQLLVCEKITWMFQTDYRYIEDLVDAGYAHLVRYEDLDRLDDRFFQRPRVDPAYLFGSATLKETLARDVLGCYN